MSQNSQSLQKEEFSYAYIKMIASIAGLEVMQTDHASDNSGIDIIIRSPGLIKGLLSPSIDAQVKCVSTALEDGDFIIYNLKVRNYKRLIGLAQAPQILILVLVPKDINLCFSVNSDKIVFSASAYWLNLFGYEDTDKKDESKVRIKIPKENLLTVDALKTMMIKVADNYVKRFSLNDINMFE